MALGLYIPFFLASRILWDPMADKDQVSVLGSAWKMRRGLALEAQVQGLNLAQIYSLPVLRLTENQLTALSLSFFIRQ